MKESEIPFYANHSFAHVYYADEGNGDGKTNK